MLRTFRSNPSLGGFGSHDSPSDAVCQILKELVDNAVDACSMAGDTDEPKRVRVVFEPTSNQNNNKDDSNDNNNNETTLRVTITDNGVGMADIEQCVGAFHSSKAQTAVANPSDNESSSQIQQQPQTAGRYGIGLTLCLLHAQRLVADSCASIQSATSNNDAYAIRTVVVDAQSDTVQCLPQPRVTKNRPDESGTAISLLIPEETLRLMPGLDWPSTLPATSSLWDCSAASKSWRQPSVAFHCMFVLWCRKKQKAAQQKASSQISNSRKRSKSSSQSSNHHGAADSDTGDDDNDNSVWQNGLDDDDAASDASGTSKKATKNKKQPSVSEERLQIWKATSSFLGRPVELANVAHEMVPIRIKKDGTNKNKRPNKNGPKLEVNVIVHGPNDDDDSVDSSLENENNGDDMMDVLSYASDHSEGNNNNSNKKRSKQESEALSACATLTLVRMVNKIPLLDSSEAIACGLVQGLSAKKRLWNSFGLDVRNAHDPANASRVPTYEVRDSEQVAPFFKSGAHNLLEEGVAGETIDEEQDHGAHTKAKNKHRNLLPAAVRLGNILVIVQIHAEPSNLPLPTLSKGRLPADSKAINDAFEVGLTKCLQQLQKTNPNLLLTAAELRRVERDIKYVPAVSLALASIVSNAVGSASDPALKERILSWRTQGGPSRNNIAAVAPLNDNNSTQQNQEAQEASSVEPNQESELEQMGRSIEERLRLILSQPDEKSKKKKASKKASKEEAKEETKSETSELSSIDDLASLGVDWDAFKEHFNSVGSKKKSKKRSSDEDSSTQSQSHLEDLVDSRTPKNKKRSQIVSPEDDNGFYTDW